MDKPNFTRMMFDNDGIDFMPKDKRKALVFELFKKQFIHNKKNVPFYTDFYKNVSESDLKTYEDCIEKVPVLSKLHIRRLESPYDMLDQDTRENLSSIYLHRGTGGTTGEPTSMFFSLGDWQAVLGAMTRPLKELNSLKRHIIACNCYNQGHISGPIFDDTIRKIGGTPIIRHFKSDDEGALRLMARHRCNLIIAPSVSTHKGGSVENLLEADSKLGLNYINGKNIDVLFCSSTNMTEAIHKELKGLGIKYIYNYYGSTDVLPTAISCQDNPFEFHILEGHISLFVVDKNQKHVKSGERGFVIAGRISGYDKAGMPSLNQATQILNFSVGDEVTFIDTPCSCGRTTPRIKDIERKIFVEDKMAGGCEVW